MFSFWSLQMKTLQCMEYYKKYIHSTCTSMCPFSKITKCRIKQIHIMYCTVLCIILHMIKNYLLLTYCISYLPIEQYINLKHSGHLCNGTADIEKSRLCPETLIPDFWQIFEVYTTVNKLLFQNLISSDFDSLIYCKSTAAKP